MGSWKVGSEIDIRSTLRFTEADIPDYHTRVAVNCFNADVSCNMRLSKKCRIINPEMWRKCPKQTQRVYRHKE